MAQVITNNPSSSANTLYGHSIAITESSNLANTVQGMRIRFTDAGTGASTKTGIDVDVTTANANDTTYAAILQGGNVGIGTSSPGVKLHVDGGSDAALGSGGYIQAGATNSTNLLLDDNELMARNNGAAGTLSIQADGGTVNILNSTTGTFNVNNGLLYANNSGLVSVGTTSPAARFEVSDTNRISGTSVAGSGRSLGNVTLVTTDAQGQDIGAILALGGMRGTTNGLGVFGGIRGAKENGTNDNNAGYLGFYTLQNGVAFAERMRISSTGLVGIGTSAPTGDLSFGGEAARTIQMEVRTGNAAGNNLTIKAGGAGPGATGFAGGNLFLQGGNAAGTSGNANGGNAYIFGGTAVNSGTAGNVILAHNGTSAIGNVGIGTAAPVQKLSVVGTSGAAGILSVFTGTGLATDESLTMGIVDGSYGFIQAFKFGTGARNLALNPSGGNVGIGTTSPGTKLQVSAANTFTGNLGTTALSQSNAVIVTTDVQGTDIGGFLGLGGYNDNAASVAQLFGGIKAAKENNTSGTKEGYLAFFTTNSIFGGSLVERMRISSGGNVGIGTQNPTADLSFGGEAARTIQMEVRTGNAAGNNLTIKAGGAGAGASAFAGGQLILQGGGAAGTGNANGGAITLSGGAGVGTGTQGLVNLATSAFTSAAEQSFSSSTSITAGNVDLYSSLPVKAITNTGLTLTIPDPAQTTIGRLLYISARSGSLDFTMRLNSSRTPIDIAMKANSTATLIWNGTDWTAAGASSSTDLQSAYNNTLTSAGGAELVLNAAGGAADGLTIRNNATTPITGGIFEVQSSIGTNLFSVNNLGTELAANGGSETSATWTTNWTTVGSATVARSVTAGEFVTGQAGARITTTSATNDGIRNNLSGNPAASTTYQVSFAAKSNTNGTPIDVQYSPNGGSTLLPCSAYSTQTLSNTIWTKITCTVTTDATSVTNPDLLIRKTNGTTPIIYIDNLSFMRNDSTTQPSNVQIGGGINGGPVTLFTLDRSTAPPVANGDTTYLGSMYYDTTTGRIQCYEADGWGACGSAPDNIITLTPEYTGAVLNGNGIGTMTADFCGNGGGLSVNTSFCASGEARSYYRWTSPQTSDQTYSIYVNYKLPSTFKQFIDDNTIKLTAYKDHATNAGATLEVYRKNVASGTITQCGSTTTITTSTSAWNTTQLGGSGETSCGFAAGDYAIFKITVTAKNAANVYIENLDFTFTNK